MDYDGAVFLELPLPGLLQLVAQPVGAFDGVGELAGQVFHAGRGVPQQAGGQGFRS